MKLSLREHNIPRNKKGDPFFQHGVGERLYDVFNPEQVCELVNRSLYQLEYQVNSHAKYREQRQSLEKPVREMFHSLYPQQSFAKATNEQLSACIAKIKEKQ